MTLNPYANDGWSVTAHTDFIDNANTKKAFEEINWDNYNMEAFDFKNLTDMINDDEF